MATIELPPFSSEQKQVSDLFVARLQSEIKASGSLPFIEYMHRSLYEPELGYYVNGFSKLGRHGDFTTAPEMSDDFAVCIAMQCQQVFSHIGAPDILEFGGGSGKLACDVLRVLAELECLPQRYLILDVSAELVEEQHRLIHQQLPPAIADKVHWLDTLPDKFCGAVIANEVFDAFAVERFSMIDGEAQRVMVNCSDQGFYLQTVVDESVQQTVMQIQQDAGTEFADGFVSEYCPLLEPWWQTLSECIDKGAVIVCDYGTDRRNYYAAQKPDGTLRCFFRHALHDDPFARPAVQDITADVDFTALTEAALKAGLELQGYTPLAEFMLSLGVLDYHEKKLAALDVHQQIEATGDLKRLILPTEMGDRFMVIGFSKGFDVALDGFARADWSRLL